MTNARSETTMQTLAERYFDDGYNCAESILRASAETFPISLPVELVRIGSGFSGGIGYTGQICGALVASVMVIGWAWGREVPHKKAKQANRAAHQITQQFVQRFGTTSCTVLRDGLGFGQPECRKRCREMTGTTAWLLAELLRQSGVEPIKNSSGRPRDARSPGRSRRAGRILLWWSDRQSQTT